MNTNEIMELIKNPSINYNEKIIKLERNLIYRTILNLLKEKPEIAKEILIELDEYGRKKCFWSEVTLYDIIDYPEICLIAEEDKVLSLEKAPIEVTKLFIEKNMRQKSINWIYGFDFDLSKISPEMSMDILKDLLVVMKETSEEKDEEISYRERKYSESLRKWNFLSELLKNIPEEIQRENENIFMEYMEISELSCHFIPFLCKELQMKNIDGCQNYISIYNTTKLINVDVLKMHPELYKNAIKNDIKDIPMEIQMMYLEELEKITENEPEFLRLINVDVLIKDPKICSNAIYGLINNYEEYDEAYFYSDEGKNKELTMKDLVGYMPNAVKCMDNEIVNSMLMDATDYEIILGKLSYEAQVKHLDVVGKSLDINLDESFKKVDPAILERLPELCERAVGINYSLMRYVPENLQIKNKQMCINILEKNVDAYKMLYYLVKGSPEITQWMFKDPERMIKIRNKSYFEVEDVDVMDTLYHKMIMSIGFDEIERFLQVPNMKKEDIERFEKEYNEQFDRLFEKKYILKGEISSAIELFKVFDSIKYRSIGKNVRFEIFKNINKNLDDNNLSLDELLQKSIEQSGLDLDTNEILDKFKTVKKSILSNLSDERLGKVEHIINEKLDNNFSNLLVSPIKIIIERKLKENIIKNDGSINVEEIIKSISDEIERRNENGVNVYSPHIISQKENIESFTRELLEEKNFKRVVSKPLINILREAKDKIGQGWIRKLQGIPQRLDEKEYQILQKRLGIELEAEYNIVLKENVDEFDEKEALKILSELEVPEVLTSKKVELMFSKMKPPYSEEFRKYYKQHREEILKRPEVYSMLSEIHNKFDTIINRPETKNIYENGKLTVDIILRAMNEPDYSNIREGNNELAELSSKVGLSQEEFDKAQEIFEITKKREGSHIPYIETTKKKYRGRILRADDSLNIIVGNITTCCQRVDDWGEASMMHGATEDNGAIFVIEELDEQGNSKRIIGQSWTWRNNSRICFDNIEITEGIYQGLSVEDQKEILEIYRKTAERMINVDDKLMKRLLKEEKITQEIYDRIALREVTVGLNQYNDLNELDNMLSSGELRSTSELILPKEKDKYYHGLGIDRQPWVDSGETQVILAEIDKTKREEIDKRVSKSQIVGRIEDEKNDEDMTSIPEIYKSPREIIRCKLEDLSLTNIEKIKKIERITFREGQQILQDCMNSQEIAESQNISLDAEVIMSKDGDWYMIGEETEKEYYISDLAMVGGVNSQKNDGIEAVPKTSTFEITEIFYEKLLEMAKKGKVVSFDATRDTSYININRAVEKGLVEIINDEEFEFGDTDIEMNSMVVKPISENIEIELKAIKEIMEKLKRKQELKTVPNNSEER